MRGIFPGKPEMSAIRSMASADGAATGERYVAFYRYAEAAGLREGIVQGIGADRVVSLPSGLIEALRHCDRFRTLEQHRAHLRDLGWREQVPGEILAGLRELATQGLLVDNRTLLRRLAHPPDESDRVPITTIAWTTSDRPISLARAIGSTVEHLARHHRECRLVVLDDSQSAATRHEVVQVLGELQSSLRIEMFYAGAEEKERFRARLAATLAHRGVSEAVTRFALFDPHAIGRRHGINRNALRLATDGETVLMLDDDVVCLPADDSDASGDAEHLMLTSDYYPTEVTVYPDRRALLDATPRAEVDVLSAHERLLGRSVETIVRELAPHGRFALEGISSRFAATLALRPARVAATMSGLYGDAAFGSPTFLLTQGGTAHDRIVESEASYRAALASREVRRSVPRYVISAAGFLMSTADGLDHRFPTPPWFPVLRGEDNLFALTLRACSPGSLVGYVPVSLYHDPPESRRFDPAATTRFSLGFLEMLLALTGRLQAGLLSDSAESRMRALGRLFTQVASTDLSSFQRLLGELVITEIQRSVERLEDLLELYGREPPYWAEDVEALAKSARDGAGTGDLLLPRNLQSGRSAGETLELMRTLIREYGKLLEAWPAVLEASRYLHEGGHPLLRGL